MKVFENKNNVKWFTSNEKGVRTLHCIYNTDKFMYYLIAKKYWFNEKNKFHHYLKDFDRINKPIEELTGEDIIKNLSTIIFKRNLITEEDMGKQLHNVKWVEVTIDGITYPTIRAARKALGIGDAEIRRRAGLPPVPSDYKKKTDKSIIKKKNKDINVNENKENLKENEVEEQISDVYLLDEKIAEYKHKIQILEEALNILTGENK
jgi:hypothetical protein